MCSIPFSVCAFSDCADEITRNYGETYYFDVPGEAEFLQFTPLGSQEEPKVLWNRTNPKINKGGRGQMTRYAWEIVELTQADNGYYNFRKEGALLSRIRLTVQGDVRDLIECELLDSCVSD